MTTRDATVRSDLFGNFRRKTVRAEREHPLSTGKATHAEVQSAVTLELLYKLIETLTHKQTAQEEDAAHRVMEPTVPYLAKIDVGRNIERMIHDIVDEKIQELILSGRVSPTGFDIAETQATARDPLAAARARGAIHMKAELDRPDNLNLDAAAACSGSSTRHINQLRNEGKLYALVPEGTTRGFRYPSWQFDAERSRLTAVLRELHAHKLNCWAMHAFLTRPNEYLGQAPRDSILDPEVPLENILKAVDQRFGGADQGAS
jgi:hypothetical protein